MLKGKGLTFPKQVDVSNQEKVPNKKTHTIIATNLNELNMFKRQELNYLLLLILLLFFFLCGGEGVLDECDVVKWRRKNADANPVDFPKQKCRLIQFIVYLLVCL